MARRCSSGYAAQAHLEKGYIVIAAGGIGQPYVMDYPSVQRALELRGLLR
jgi:uridylate kinase